MAKLSNRSPGRGDRLRLLPPVERTPEIRSIASPDFTMDRATVERIWDEEVAAVRQMMTLLPLALAMSGPAAAKALELRARRAVDDAVETAGLIAEAVRTGAFA